ncbi:transglutaminase family protein [Leptospira sp. GIMC2001]|uniref:transglutaminase family protein n=1 Tax=Leptospira sp. GIMC2001 TaxID=1513297 RepID=UPI00234BF51B|nr:transglutaminase family protein [Leptospira sp. GIMC2001]WCL49343.1 transglutaminase family protein [Leptospira sp. GIMC2001]
MPDYKIIHKTIYSYESTVSHCINLAHMYPPNTPHQECYRTFIDVNPRPSASSFRKDYFGNNLFFFSIEDPHKQLEVKVESSVKTNQPSYANFARSCPWPEAQTRLMKSTTRSDIEALEYLLPSAHVPFNPKFAEYAAISFADNKSILESVHDFTIRIFNDFEFDPKATTIVTPLEQVFEQKKGVCQDFTHFAISALRSFKIPARYVSGYIETHPPIGQKKLQGSDATHAWLSVYCPDQGWVDFDPTNGKFITDEYVITAIGRDYSDVSPLKGILFGGGKHKLKVEVDVLRE